MKEVKVSITIGDAVATTEMVGTEMEIKSAILTIIAELGRNLDQTPTYILNELRQVASMVEGDMINESSCFEI